MIFIPTFLRSSFPVHALGQFPLTIFLLSLGLCFLVSSYTIDDSCQNYQRLGNDIKEDIARAMEEAQLLASNAFDPGFVAGPSIRNLLVSLFGTDHLNHATVVSHFASFHLQGFTQDLVIICDDQSVQWELDVYQNRPDPLGLWIDHRHEWMMSFTDFNPCNPARKFLATHDPPLSYIVAKRFIYLCPLVLDKPQGRSVVPYRDQDLTGNFIDEFILLPVVLLIGLLHIHDPSSKPSSR